MKSLAPKIILAITLMLLPVAAHPGMVVSDPQSYSYYVEQLKKQAEEIEKLSKQLETMNGVLTKVNDIEAKMMGHYNRAMGLYKRLERIQKLMSSEGDGMVGTLKKWGRVGREVAGGIRSGAGELDNAGDDYKDLTGEDLAADTMKLLDMGFGDPRDTSDPMAKYRALDRQYAMKQQALKGVVANSEKLLGSVGDRIGNIKELASQVDATENTKDAQDLTNRILLEVLATLTDMLAIAAQANQASALLNYTGTTDATMEARKKALESAQGSVESSLSQLLKNGPNFSGGSAEILQAGRAQFK